MWYEPLLDRGLIPDPLLRAVIRRRLAALLRERGGAGPAALEAQKQAFVAALRKSPVAVRPDAANEQHYELPAAFYGAFLGPRLKYSCCLWPEDDAGPSSGAGAEPGGPAGLANAEEAMLALTCERAGLRDGMDVLELGCGWGSLCLWIGERYPRSRVTAVSNAHGQRRFIEERAAALRIHNVRAVTADVNLFEPEGRGAGQPAPRPSRGHATDGRFDRVVSVEMFEHLRNWPAMLARIGGWLRPEGRLFLHVFSHRDLAYPYESDGGGGWMARRFFTAGIMPSHDLVRRCDEHLVVEEEWRLSGAHYARTLEAWLQSFDRAGVGVERPLAQAHGVARARAARNRWRVFFMACAETFGYADGTEWGVSHYLLRPP